ncbi:MAG TPA: hypothetical protein VJR89_02510 [Polyangiales bacterium]|nr:hypothetical protein [Polyangiales bacterium]
MTTPDSPVPSTSGIAVMDLLHVLAEMVGQAKIERAKGRLSPAQRQTIDALTAVSWLPNTTLALFVDELARCVQRDAEAMIDEAVRAAVDRTFKTVWRMFLRVTSDEALIKRTPIIYQRSRNIGQLSARILEPGNAEALLTQWPDVPDRHLRTIGVSIARVMELAGRRDVRMTAHRTPDGGRYQLRWRSSG